MNSDPPPALPTSANPSLPPLATSRSTELAALWAGYGALHRVSAPVVRGGPLVPLVLKQIDLSGGADDTSLSHRRKVASYAVETTFYLHYAPSLPASVPVAQAYASRTAVAKTGSVIEGVGDGGRYPAYSSLTLALADLSPSFPVDGDSQSPLNRAAAGVVLTWLARFHAHFWGFTGSGVWRRGGYWYLATRPAEHARALRSPVHAWLAAKADKWDKYLEETSVALVHGDAKCANVLFSSSVSECAFVDFQYVGRGNPMSDVAKLLATSVEVEGTQLEGWVRDVYYPALVAAKPDVGVTADMVCEWAEVAMLDWARFAAGWGWWGNVKWVHAVVAGLRAKWDT
ncbi:hypothetical protein H9P43_006668 [Blastocladiella emersonii ATCC 22665]|nr:hypothetical protein H9P43_006668 [Blastocladiella emersonii ATCC 22665]